jgi:hypothetical protein
VIGLADGASAHTEEKLAEDSIPHFKPQKMAFLSFRPPRVCTCRSEWMLLVGFTIFESSCSLLMHCLPKVVASQIRRYSSLRLATSLYVSSIFASPSKRFLKDLKDDKYLKINCVPKFEDV